MAASTGAQAPPAALYERRARSVWLIILTSVVLFCVVCSATSVGAYSYLVSVTRSEQATVEKIRGSQLVVQRHLHKDSEAVDKSTVLSEGDLVITGSDTEANVDLFDRSTVHLYFSTYFQPDTLRASRFLGSQEQVRLVVQQGTAVLSTASGDVTDYSEADYTIVTPHAQISVGSNSTVRVQVDPENTDAGTQVVSTFGGATVMAGGKRVPLESGQMVTVSAAGEPSEAHQPETELVQNGDFKDPPTSGKETVEGGGLGVAAWQPILEQSSVDPSDTTPISNSVVITREALPGQSITAALITRDAKQGRYARIGLHQDINAPASFLRYLELRATVKVVQQTEPVGGPQGDVFPLTIKVLYTNAEGKQQSWQQSFYWGGAVVDPSVTTSAPLGAWYTTPPADKSSPPNKFVLKQVDSGATIGQDIAVINAIEIYGIGDKYQSWVTDVSLIAR